MQHSKVCMITMCWILLNFCVFKNVENYRECMGCRQPDASTSLEDFRKTFISPKLFDISSLHFQRVKMVYRFFWSCEAENMLVSIQRHQFASPPKRESSLWKAQDQKIGKRHKKELKSKSIYFSTRDVLENETILSTMTGTFPKETLFWQHEKKLNTSK